LIETNVQPEKVALLGRFENFRKQEKVLIWSGIVGLTLLGLGLRLWHIDAIPMVWDEVFNYNVARQDLGDIFNSVANAIEPPFYYLLFHLWSIICGGANTEFNARFLSVIIGTAIIPTSYWFFRRLVNPWWALVGAAMVTANGYHLYYSQYGKNYVLVTLLSFASLALFLDLISKNQQVGWRRWATWTVLNVLIVYTHYFSAYIIIGEYVVLVGLIAFGKIERRKALLHSGATVLGALLLYLPWLPNAYRSLHERVTDPNWLYYKLDFDFFFRQVAGLPNLFLGLEVTDQWLYGMVGLLVLGGVTAFVANWRANRKVGAVKNDSPVYILGLLLPAIILPYLGVMIYTNSQLETRNFLGGVGAIIYTLLVVMAERLWRWKIWLGVVAVLALFLITAYSGRNYFHTATHGDDYRVMVSQIRQLEKTPNPPALMIPMKPVEDVLRFYMTRQELQNILVYPKSLKDYLVPPQGLVVVMDARFAELDWSLKELRGHLQTVGKPTAYYSYPGCQIFVYMPG